MLYYINLFKKYIRETQNGKIFFDFGILLLPTAFFLSALFLIFSLILSIKNSSKSYFQDRWNFPFFISSIFLIVNCFLVTIANSELQIEEFKTFIPWIGLTNWVPFFICFWGFQDYLSNPSQRKNCAKLLVIGSVPVFLSGFTQLWLDWSGPWEILNGIIVWYQRPVTQNFGSLSGLFNNPNYAGAWLNVIWPFCLSTIFQKSFNKRSKYIALVIAICFGLAIFLTSSRSAWLGFCLSSYLMIIGLQNLIFLKWIIPLIFTSIFITITHSTFTNEFSFIEKIIPNTIYRQFDPSTYADWDMSRFEIWGKAIEFISQRPIIGWGSGAFSILLFSKYEIYKGHAHNLILELAVSYGIIVTLIIVFTIVLLLIKSSKKMLIKRIKLFDKDYNLYIFERAWWVSTFTLLFGHMFDVQYFDGRISIILWIFLTGLKSSNSSEFKKE